MKKIIVDLDGTLTIDTPNVDYRSKLVNWPVVKRLREYKELGYEVSIFTARNMRTYEGNLELIKANTLPVIEDWLTKHAIPYDEIIIGKPWCGTEGYYVDDRTIRPDEFARMSPDEAHRFMRGNDD